MLGVAVSSSSPSTSPAPPLEPSPGNLEFLKLFASDKKIWLFNTNKRSDCFVMRN